ncbi:MAG: hypothetical protein K0U23_06695 [Gammaproteobacteria bacterium]|nr:hypothetical protein [Gammaproteobacteria bacterium]
MEIGKNDAYMGALQGIRHVKKGRVAESDFHFICIKDPASQAEAEKILATVTNRSRIYLGAHGIVYDVHQVEAHGKDLEALSLAGYLKDKLTHRSLREAHDDQRLRISLIVCLAGLGMEEHKKFVTVGSGRDVFVDNAAFAEAETDNFEESFAIMLCAQLYDDGAGIICDVVGRRDIPPIIGGSAEKKAQMPPDIMNKRLQEAVLRYKKRGLKLKTYKMMRGENFIPLKSGSLKFIATTNDKGQIVFYDEYEDFFYSFIKHSVIPTMLGSQCSYPKKPAAPASVVTTPDAEDIQVMYTCIEELEVAAQEILHDQIIRGEGEERTSKELALETRDRCSVATKLSRSADFLNADYLKIITVLEKAVTAAKGSDTICLLRLIENKTRLFALAMGATDAPEVL